MTEEQAADFQIPRIAEGIRLYMNKTEDHGILQMINNVDEAESLPVNGEHVVCQLAFTREQLHELATQLEALAQKLKGEDDG